MTPETALAAIADQVGLPGLTYGTNRQCDLEIGGDLVVSLISDRDRTALDLIGWIGHMAEDGEAIRNLMGLNLSGAVPEGGWFAVDPATQQIVVRARLPLEEMSEDGVVQRTASFIAAARHWQESLPQLHELGPSPAMPTDTAELIRL